MYRVELKAGGALADVWLERAFLMYRVELKASSLLRNRGDRKAFLMYRVELKASKKEASPWSYRDVPNVPCGVESMNIKLPIYLT